MIWFVFLVLIHIFAFITINIVIVKQGRANFLNFPSRHI